MDLNYISYMNKVRNYKDINLGSTYKLVLMKNNNRSWTSVKVIKKSESKVTPGVEYLILENNKSKETMTLFAKFYNRGWYLEDDS